MSFTTTYSALHLALTQTAKRHGLEGYDVRVLLALLERGGQARTDELEMDLLSEGTAVRRSVCKLRVNAMIRADAGEGTIAPKPGIRSRLTLLAEGRVVAEDAARRASAFEGEKAAA